MAGNSPTSGEQPEERKPLAAGASMRKWMAVAAAFTGTLALALFLVKWQIETRQNELGLQYAMSAARVGRAIELKYQSNREVVNSVTNVLRLGESEAKSALLEIEGARAKTELNDQLDEAAARLWQGLRRAQDEKANADAAAARAWGEAFDAVNACMDKVKASTGAQDDVVRAALAINAAQNELDLALSALRAGNGSAQSAKEQAPPPPNAPEPSSVAVLRERLTVAKSALSAKKAAADGADKAVTSQCQSAAGGKTALATKAVQAALKSDQELARVRQEFDQRLQDLRSPSRLIAAGMKRHLPPSYAPDVDACAAGAGNVEVCVANAIAKINGSAAPLVACPSVGAERIDAPTLTEDGMAVAIPSSDRSEHLVCAKLPLDELLAIRPSPQTQLAERESGSDSSFDAVVLLTPDGGVLRALETGSSHLRIAVFPEFKPEQAKASSVAANVELGPEKYRAFFQPVRIALAARATGSEAKAHTLGERSDVVVAGLVRETRLASAATQISLPSYLWFVLLLAFGLLCLPLAKLWFLGTTSSFGRFDVTLLGASAVLITLLTGVLTLGLVAHNRLASRLDRQLATVAARLGVNMAKLVEQRASELDMLLEHDQQPCGDGQTTLATFAGEEQPYPVCEHVQQRGHLPRGELLFFADADGRQTIKYTDEDRTTTPISVGFRGYFQRALRHEPVCAGATGCRLRAVPDVVRSATSGKMVLVVARSVDPAQIHKALGDAPTDGTAQPASGDAPGSVVDRSRVVALEAELPLTDLILPKGFQAAVIDEAGSAVLHSDSDARFGQPLFDDVDDADELRAALASGVPRSLSLRYLGVPSRMTIQPLKLDGTRWFAVAVAPSSLVDVPAVNMGLTTLVGYGAALVVLLLGVFLLSFSILAVPWLLGWRAWRGTKDFSIRPDARFAATYARLGRWTLLATLLLSGFSFGSSSCSAVWLGLAALATFVVLLWFPGFGIEGPLEGLRNWFASAGARVGPKGGLWLGKLRERLVSPSATSAQLRVSYPFAVFGFCSLMVLAPSAALFASAYDYYADCMVRAEHRHYQDALRLRPSCMSLEKALPECQNVIYPDTTTRVKGLPPETTPAQPSPPTRAALLDLRDPIPWLAKHGPRIGSELPTFLMAAAVRFFPFSDYRHKVIQSDPQGHALFETEVPRLFTRMYDWVHLSWALVGFATFMGIGWVISSASLRRLFFLHALDERPASCEIEVESLLAPKSGALRVLVLHPSDTLRAQLAAQPGYVDFGSLTEAERRAQPPDTLWVLPELRSELDNARMAMHVAEAATHAQRFVLLSRVEPLRRVKPELRKLWTDALKSFDEREARVVGSASSDDRFVGRPTHVRMAAWWDGCDDDERRVLSQLAEEDYTNPHPANVPAIKHLVGRGLLSPDTLTIASREFEKYVKHAPIPDERRRWKSAGENTLWQSIRVPLATGVVALLTALAASKPELGVAGALVPLATVSLPSLLRILAATLSPK